MAWTLRNPAVDGAIVGFRRLDQVEPILDAARIQLTNDDVREIASEPERDGIAEPIPDDLVIARAASGAARRQSRHKLPRLVPLSNKWLAALLVCCRSNTSPVW